MTVQVPPTTAPTPGGTTPSLPVEGPAAPRSAAPGHRRPPRRALVAASAALLLILGWAAYQLWEGSRPLGPLTASGTVEADEVMVAAEVSGRLVALPAEEGRAVSSSDVLARVDDSLVQVQYQQADAATRQQLNVQLERYTLRSPLTGVITSLPVRLGEVVVPGQTVAAVANLRQLKLTLYVLERDLGRVQVGQTVHISADPYPGRLFQGTVSSVNSRAEFTPRNVQTQRDRMNVVFGVKVRVDNQQGALKPGMPVDATFETAP